MYTGIKEQGLVRINLKAGKRAHLSHVALDQHGDMIYDKSPDLSDWDWWIGWGKSESYHLEGPWLHMAILAARILSHPNTQKVAPNLYFPGIKLTEEQENSYY